jgi:DNA-binding NarL/FixJ family response regulator
MTIKVFLVDDHTIFREGLYLLLDREQDIEIIGEAEDGHEAIKKVPQKSPDVVIMDIAMPNLNGIEATRQIKADHPDIDILMLSMKNNAEDAYQALKAGACGYILKKSAGEEVVEAVRTAYDGERFLSNQINKTLVENYIIENKRGSPEDPLEDLSPREKEVLQLVAEGKATKEIARMLHLSKSTVETYRKRMMKKLGLSNLTELIKFSIKHEIITV